MTDNAVHVQNASFEAFTSTVIVDPFAGAHTSSDGHVSGAQSREWEFGN